MRIIAYRTVCLLLVTGLTGSCASVDQYGSRAYDGNLNTQDAFNKEILANIIRASQYQALSWNPPSQITGTQMEQLTTGLPTINVGPAQTAAQGVYSITNSVQSSVNGGFSTAPLATTSFQTGMLTPVDLKIIASLTTYYPREVIFYAMIAAIDVKSTSAPARYNRLVNDPSQAYYDTDDSDNLDPSKCNKIINDEKTNPLELLFWLGPNDKQHLHSRQCSYEKFLNFLSDLIQYGMYTELVQAPAQQPAQAQANQSNIVTFGRFCSNKYYIPGDTNPVTNTGLP